MTSGLTWQQKLALLPASVPECVLDFLEEFGAKEPFQDTTRLQSLTDERFWERKQNEFLLILQAWAGLGEPESVEAQLLTSQYPGAVIIELRFGNGESRSMGFIVSQGSAPAGMIRLIYALDESRSDPAKVREKIATYYKQKD